MSELVTNLFPLKIFQKKSITSSGDLKNSSFIKTELELNDNLYYRWIQMMHAIPGEWKSILTNNRVSRS